MEENTKPLIANKSNKKIYILIITITIISLLAIWYILQHFRSCESITDSQACEERVACKANYGWQILRKKSLSMSSTPNDYEFIWCTTR